MSRLHPHAAAGVNPDSDSDSDADAGLLEAQLGEGGGTTAETD